jgi:hypothetical protein
MSFFDKARAGAELGEIDRHYRDLGLLAYLAATGRAVDPAAQQQLLAVLRGHEERGAIRDFVLGTTGQPAVGAPPVPQRPGGSDGIPQPPPERAGRHGDFLGQPRASESTWAPSDPDGTTGPRPTPPPPPSIGGTWGPPQQGSAGPVRWQPVRARDDE